VIAEGSTVGVLEGRVTNAARENFESSSFRGDRSWLNLASERAFALCSHEGEQLAIQQSLIEMGYLAESRPLFICERKVVSLAGLLEKLKVAGRVWVRLENVREERFELKATDSLSSIYGLTVDPDRAYTLVNLQGEFERSGDLKRFIESGDSMLAGVFQKIASVLGQDCVIDANYVESEYGKDFVDVTFSRA
jgi:hypothetical protein